MFKFIESICPEPIRLFAKPDIKLKPGNVIELNEEMLCVLSDGAKPFGVVGEIVNTDKALVKLPADNKYKTLIKVYTQRMVFQTSNFDKEREYTSGCSLYVKNGIFTSEAPREDAFFVAKMITPAGNGRDYFEALWF